MVVKLKSEIENEWSDNILYDFPKDPTLEIHQKC